MEIGINKLCEILIKILIERNIDIYHISHYLENNKNSKFKNNFDEIAPNIIFLYNTIKIEKKKLTA